MYYSESSKIWSWLFEVISTHLFYESSKISPTATLVACISITGKTNMKIMFEATVVWSIAVTLFNNF